MRAMTFTLSHPGVFGFAGKVGRMVMNVAPFMVSNGLNPWYKQREMPAPPEESFREWYSKNRNGESS
jgi:L-lactate dehydrogenase complex protein LldF